MNRNVHERAALLLMGLAAASGLVTTPVVAASEPGADANQCVFFRTVYDWKALDQTHLLIWAPGRHDAYEVELGSPLTSLRFADKLAFVDHNGDGRLCGFGMDRVIVPDTPLREDAIIVGLSRLDESSLAALADRYGVKLSRTQLADAGTDSDHGRRAE